MCALISVPRKMKVSDLKSLHANTPNGWLKCMNILKNKRSPSSVIKGFEKARIMEAVKSAQDIYTKCENPLDDRRQKLEINF